MTSSARVQPIFTRIPQVCNRAISAPFASEQELELIVQANAEYIFGPDSLYLPKSPIKTYDDFGTIPDGFVIDLASKTWFIVEAELSIHSVWNHIAPQIAKQIIAASQPASRRMLTEMVINRVKEISGFRERFEELGVIEIDICRVVSEIFDGKPIVGNPFDQVGTGLRQWAQTLKCEVKLWVIRKLVEFGNRATSSMRSLRNIVQPWIHRQNQSLYRPDTPTMTSP
jgi:hypothetical protein